MSTVFKRSEFAGITDVYAPALRQSTAATNYLDDAVRGVRPADVAGPALANYTVLGSAFNSAYITQAEHRLSAYREAWDFYGGKHFTIEQDGNVRKTPVNFARAAVKKRAVWAVGKGMTMQGKAGNEYVTDCLMRVWKRSNYPTLFSSLMRTTLITGDGYLMLNVIKVDAEGKQLPKDRWYVSVIQLNPSYCFPIWNESDPNRLAGIMIQFPAVMATKEEEARERLFTMVITASRVMRYVDTELQSDEVNPLGLINVVHIPNESECNNVFGVSLVREIMDLNKAYNDTLHSIRRICNYHGEPATIVYGIRLSQMERGAGKVWSGLPGEGKSKVENLVLGDDLEAMYKTLTTLEQQIYNQARTPKISYDVGDLHISNTSGVAMALMFQPLIESSIGAQSALANVIQEGNEIITRIHQVYFGENLFELADDPDCALETRIDFESVLPRDEPAYLDMAIKKHAAKAWSHAEFIRRVSGVADTERLALELAADARSELADSLNKARALQGQPFNPSGVFLGSPFLSEDLLDTAAQLPATSSLTSDTGED